MDINLRKTQSVYWMRDFVESIIKDMEGALKKGSTSVF